MVSVADQTGGRVCCPFVLLYKCFPLMLSAVPMIVSYKNAQCIAALADEEGCKWRMEWLPVPVLGGCGDMTLHLLGDRVKKSTVIERLIIFSF